MAALPRSIRAVFVRRFVRRCVRCAPVLCAWLPGPALAAQGTTPEIALQEALLTGASGAGAQAGGAVSLSDATALVGAAFADPAAVPDGGAAYVFTTGGAAWSSQAVLVAADVAAGDELGVSVSVAGDLAVVGAWRTDDLGPDAGSAYVFERSGTSWSQQVELTAGDGAAGDGFGASVAMSGTTLVAGAPDDDDAGSSSGAAYVFVRSGTVWSQQAKLVAADAQANDAFGASVAIDGDTLIVGAAGEDAGGPDAGAAYVFVRTGTSWAQQAKLAGGGFGWRFGASVSVSGERVAVGAPLRDHGFAGVLGEAYVYARSGSAWALEASFEAEDSADFDEFANAVALDGDRLLVAAHKNDVACPASPVCDSGSVYAYRFAAGVWSKQLRVTAGAAQGDRFGAAIALSGDRALVGSPFDDDVGLDAGSAAVLRFGVPYAASNEAAVLVSADIAPEDTFATDVAADGDTLVVGVPGDDDGGAGSGSAYVFVRAGTTWIEQQKLVATDAAPGDGFGASAGLNGDTLVVGAPLDDDAGAFSGAAYVFVRAGTTWMQQAKLTASDAAGGDRFGNAVDVEGDRVLIGAHFEDGASVDEGAAYVFVCAGTAWSEEAKLVASGADVADRFGSAVALAGDAALVGAPQDDDGGTSAGAAFVFRRAGTSWLQEAKLVAGDAQSSDGLGIAVALASAGGTERALLGAHQQFADRPGKAYVFARNGTTWAQEARLDPPDGHIFELFGAGVALSADTTRAVLGAPGDTPAGSTYVFARAGTQWTVQQKLVASDAGGSLGAALAFAGDAVVAGAPLHDGAGVNSGAAYVFELEGAFPSFCDGSDGSLAACPCGNAGAPDAGCDIQQGTGGVDLRVVSQERFPENRVTLIAAGYPAMGNPTSVVIRAPALDAATPIVFGDGLRCIAVPLVRLTVAFATDGSSTHAFGHGAMAGPGTFFYQLWFRSNPAMFCTPESFNMSQGRALTW